MEAAVRGAALADARSFREKLLREREAKRALAVAKTKARQATQIRARMETLGLPGGGHVRAFASDE